MSWDDDMRRFAQAAAEAADTYSGSVLRADMTHDEGKIFSFTFMKEPPENVHMISGNQEVANMGDHYEQIAEVIQGNQGPGGNVEINNRGPLVVRSEQSTDVYSVKDWNEFFSQLREGVLSSFDNDELKSTEPSLSMIKRAKRLQPSSQEDVMPALAGEFVGDERRAFKDTMTALLALPVLQALAASTIFELLKPLLLQF